MEAGAEETASGVVRRRGSSSAAWFRDASPGISASGGVVYGFIITCRFFFSFCASFVLSPLLTYTYTYKHKLQLKFLILNLNLKLILEFFLISILVYFSA